MFDRNKSVALESVFRKVYVKKTVYCNIKLFCLLFRYRINDYRFYSLYSMVILNKQFRKYTLFYTNTEVVISCTCSTCDPQKPQLRQRLILVQLVIIY